jgi:hypothetical protein
MLEKKSIIGCLFLLYYCYMHKIEKIKYDDIIK